MAIATFPAGWSPQKVVSGPQNGLKIQGKDF